MPTVHVVTQGEHLSRIAHRYGFPGWEVIYNDAANADFRQLRPNPNLIFPGDRIVIPDLKERGASAPSGATTRFKLKRPPSMLKLDLKDAAGEALRGERYELVVAEQTFTGALEGKVEHSIPVRATEALLRVWLTADEEAPTYEWTLKIGALDPITEVSGVQSRLCNLGFDCGPVDGVMGPMTESAVKAFQEKHGLEVDGVVGSRTRGKLEEIYGC